MEGRIKRMESAISTSGLHNPAQSAEAVKEEEENSLDRIESQAELSDQFSNLVVDPGGSPNFIGLASGFSLFSPQGLKCISEKIANEDELAPIYSKISNNYGVWGQGDADLWYPRPRSQHSPLPSKDVALEYVDRFLTGLNSVFPIVNEKTLLACLDQQYSIEFPPSSAWYALLNAILCLGSPRTDQDSENQPDGNHLVDYTSKGRENGAEYFRNAASCFHTLFFGSPSLMAMQAMTLMIFITSSSPNPQPAYTLSSAASNLAYTLGLHRQPSSSSISTEELEERRNIFWSFYVIEYETSHNLGRPSAINDDDIAIALPRKRAPVNNPAHDNLVYDIFQDHITLAIISKRTYAELYSANAVTKSEAERAKVRGKLDKHLQRWRESIPIKIRPEHPIVCSEKQHFHIIMLHFLYLDAMILLHRPSNHYSHTDHNDVSNLSNRSDLDSRAYASQLLCLAAARRSIHLLSSVGSTTPLVWKTLYYPLSASLVLFAHILSSPTSPMASSDIGLMQNLAAFIRRAVKPGTSFANTPTLNMFGELVGIAGRFVAKAKNSEVCLEKRSVKRGFESVAEDDNIPTQHNPSISTEDQQDAQGVASTGDSPLDFAPFISFQPEPFQSPFDFMAGTDWGVDMNMDEFWATPETWDTSDHDLTRF